MQKLIISIINIPSVQEMNIEIAAKILICPKFILVWDQDFISYLKSMVFSYNITTEGLIKFIYLEYLNYQF